MALTAELETLKFQVNSSQCQQVFYGNMNQSYLSQNNISLENNGGNGVLYRNPSGTQSIVIWRKSKKKVRKFSKMVSGTISSHNM